MTEQNDPFYVGYLPLPGSLAGLVKAFIGIGVVGALALAVVLASGQQDPGAATWDTSNVFEIEGHLSVTPYPTVYVEDPASDVGVRAVLLVSALKFGAQDRAAPMAGKRVRAKGQFINRRGRGIFELLDGDDAITVVGEESQAPGVEVLGEHALVGEITDSKCFLGVMKPGFGKTHRGCAVRCISGGIPPLFVTWDEAGEETYYLLADASLQGMHEVLLPYVAEPVRLEGRLERHGDMLIYAVDPESISR